MNSTLEPKHFTTRNALGIETRFRGPTNTRGSVVHAKLLTGDAGGIYFAWDYSLSTRANHEAASHALAVREGLTMLRIGIETKTGYIFPVSMD